MTLRRTRLDEAATACETERMAAGVDEDEGVELELDRRTLVLELHARLASATHYELLELEVDAEPKAVKRAYFKLAAVLHPDRYFGKQLGRFKPLMQAVFARVTEAHEALAHAERRAAYDAKLGLAPRAASTSSGAAPAKGAPAAPRPPAVDPKVEAAKKAAMEALKKRFLEGRGKAQQLAEQGARARAAGDLIAAAEAYRAALQYAPDDAPLRAAHDELRRAADARLHESHLRKAQLEERYGRWAEAAASWRKVLETRPDDADARQRLAHALARAKGAPGG